MFGLDAKQAEQLRAWSAEQDKKVIEQQKGTSVEHEGEAYYGCSGGALTYMFTPTSLGLVTEVKNNLTGETINLTDFDGW
ncbi:MAG: hypothetical protein WC919_05970 [Candidatus Paceibacterota bacterium]|jgi:hypothetical protein